MKKGLVLISLVFFVLCVSFVSARDRCTNPPSTCNCDIYSNITLDRDLLDCVGGGQLMFMTSGTPQHPIVLDCNEHRLYSLNSMCVTLGDVGTGNNIIIKNCKFECNIGLDLSSSTPVANITIEHNEFLTATNNWHLWLRGVKNSKIINNTFFHASHGIVIGNFNAPDTNPPSINNLFYHNNFVNVDYPYNNYNRYQNYWSSYNGEGNYWSNYDQESEGCYDLNTDGLCDSPLQLDINNYDYNPFTKETGWEIIDSDGDSIPDEEDNCLLIYNKNQWDFDNDGVGDWCDNCPLTKNTLQIDSNNNEKGDACEGLLYRCMTIQAQQIGE